MWLTSQVDQIVNLYTIPGWKEVCMKEMTFRYSWMIKEGNIDQFIPDNFIHTFLIRHPAKYIPSYFYCTHFQPNLHKGKNFLCDIFS